MSLCCAQLLSHVRLFVTPWTVALWAPLSLGILQAGILESLPCPPPGVLPNPGIEPRSPSLQVDSLLSEPPGKPKNSGVGSVSLLKGIFPTMEQNWDLLHCRWVLYQLRYQGSLKLVSLLRQSRWVSERVTTVCPQMSLLLPTGQAAPGSSV